MSRSVSIFTKDISFLTKGQSDMVDLTPQLAELLKETELTEGHVLLFIPGATAALTTIEFEPGLRKDFPDFFRRVIPKSGHYQHEALWQDGNGHSHIRASLLGPSIMIPFAKGELTLGTWQQAVLIDFDTRPRERSVVAQFTGIKKE